MLKKNAISLLLAAPCGLLVLSNPVAALAAVAPAAAPAKPSLPPSLQYMPTEPLTIAVGEIRMLPIKGKVQRLALGSGNLLSTTTVDTNLLLIAEHVGATSLLVWSDGRVYSYKVQVVPKEMAEVRAKVEALTEDIKGITLQQVGPELVLSGVAHKDVLVRLSGALKGTPGLVFNVREDEGTAYKRSVLFRVHFVEVKRSLMEQIGVQWAKNAAGPVLGYTGVAGSSGVYTPLRPGERNDNLLDPSPPFISSNGKVGGHFLGLATTITSRLNLGVSNGDVRVLASPELTARSGGKAKLQVGGEVPIPLAGAFGATNVEFKPYGIIMTIEPQIDANNVITAKVSTELSQIDPAVSVAGIPGFLTRNTSTEVSLQRGEMVALSGLVNSEMATAIDRVPGLSRIPILGRLFRSDDFRNSKSELVVLLEPEIIAPGDGLARQLRDRGATIKQEFDDKALELQNSTRPFPDNTPPVAPQPFIEN